MHVCMPTFCILQLKNSLAALGLAAHNENTTGTNAA